MKKSPPGPSLFDDVVPSVEPVQLVAVPDRSRWRYSGDVVEIRGSSRVTVWYVVVGSDDDRQRAVFRADFSKKAAQI